MGLALVMVTRGDIDLAERALRSVRPFVDDVVVLDLGSDDDAESVFADIGARVVHGAWSEDASAVRNAALEAADADWALVLEPEEWIAAGGVDLRRFVTDPTPRLGLVEVVRAPGSTAEADHPRHLAPRLLPRGVRYAGARREEPVSDLPTERLATVVCSDDTDTGRWRTDRARAEAVIVQALAARPADPLLLLRLADEYRAAGRHTEAGRTYAAALDAAPAADPARHAMVCGALESWTKAGMFPRAVAVMDDEGPRWRHSPDVTFLVGDLFFEMMLLSPGLGGELVPLVESAWERCLELGDRPDLVGAVHGRGSFLAAQNLYVLNLVLGREREAQAWSDRAASLRVPASPVGRLLG